MIRKYEVMYILDQDVKDAKEIQDKLHGLLAEGGKIVESADWGLMDFAYEINHKKKGFYSVVIVETTAEAIAEFKRVSGIDKNVVRTLVLNTENVQNYEQTTKLSKTDMTKFEEERRERKNNFVKRPFNKFDGENKFENRSTTDQAGAKKPFTPNATAKVAAKPEVNVEESKVFLAQVQAKYNAQLEAEAATKKAAYAAHEAELASITDEAEKAAKQAAYESKKSAHKALSAEERAKLDGSDSIDEPRNELQKHANALRSLVPSSEKALHTVNLRDMTKKELIKYMQKVTKVLK